MNDRYPFVNTPLPYDYDALEPWIDSKTMEIHHDRHLQTYIDKLNAALKDYPALHQLTLPQMLSNLELIPEEIRTAVQNNGGGVYNHRMFFENMAPAGSQKEKGLLGEDIVYAFGNEETFQQKLKAAALSVFGSGYAYLVTDKGGQLQIITTPNQNTPLPQGFCPVIVLDVWEHAYYLKHYNRRDEYIDDFFPLINWKKANENFLACTRR